MRVIVFGSTEIVCDSTTSGSTGSGRNSDTCYDEVESSEDVAVLNTSFVAN